MTGAPLIAPFAILRRMLMTSAADLLKTSEQIWRDWRAEACKSLPDGELARVFAVVRVTCADDIPLHIGLMQIIRDPRIQIFPIFVLPNFLSLEIIRNVALRESWASMVGFVVESHVSQLMARFTREDVCFPFPEPTYLHQSSLDKALAGEMLDLAHGAYCGPLALLPTWSSIEEIDIRSVLASCYELDTVSIFPTVSKANFDVKPPCSVSEAETWLRPMTVELPDSTREDWIAVTLKDDARSQHIIASQPARLADFSSNLTIPIPPRFASEAGRKLQVRCQSSKRIAVGNDIAISVPPQNLGPWMISAYLNRGGAGNPVMEAFAHGLGCRLAYAEDEGLELQDVPVVWGVLRDSDRILAQARDQGLHYFYIDHAYFNRGHGNSYRITRNAYEVGRVRKVRDSRLNMLNLDVRPWKKSGRSIIVCPPTEHFALAHNCSDWLENTLNALKLETDRPIIVRTKPLPGENSIPLTQALLDAHALVTHSSNVAIEAVCLGTPVFVSPTSAAAPVGSTDIGMIEAPRYPKREGWLAHLAYSQYSLEEIRDGTAWKLLMYLEDRDFV